MKYFAMVLMIVVSLLNAGLVRHWSFNEISGDIVYDEVTGKFYLTEGNPAWVIGVELSALKFDGVDDYIPADTGMQIEQPVTVALWVKSVIENSSFATVFGWNDETNRQGIQFFADALRGDGFFVRMGEQGSDLRIPDIDGDGKWHFVVFSKDVDDTVRVYLDGVLVEKALVISSFGRGYDILIGTSYKDEYFRGYIDDVRIYDHVLSAEEIISLYMNFAVLPALDSAVASDARVPGDEIDADDLVGLKFASPVPPPIFERINEKTIDSLLPLGNGHTWLSGDGRLGGIVWNQVKDRAVIALDITGGLPTIAVGDSVSLTKRGNKVAIAGSFSPVSIINLSDLGDKEFSIVQYSSKVMILLNNDIKNAQVDIFDVSGRLLRRLCGGAGGGNCTVTWNVKNIPAGVYYLRFFTKNFSFVKKIVLTK